jgi:hypothetical protein
VPAHGLRFMDNLTNTGGILPGMDIRHRHEDLVV